MHKPNGTWIRIGILALLAAGLTVSATALPITPASGTLNSSRWQGNETSQSQINTLIQPIIGSPLASYELYKQNVGEAESNLPLKDSYETSFHPANKPTGATLTYTGGDIVGPIAYLLVKDGKQTPAWYLFNLTALGWNGTDTLELSGFWGNPGGAISHVTLYGTRIAVPDGGPTLALLGLAIGLLGVAHRRLAR